MSSLSSSYTEFMAPRSDPTLMPARARASASTSTSARSSAAAAASSQAPPTFASSTTLTGTSLSFAGLPVTMTVTHDDYRPCSRDSNSSRDSYASSFDHHSVSEIACHLSDLGVGPAGGILEMGAALGDPSATLEPTPSGAGFKVRTRLDDSHDFMVEVTWSELVRLLVDPTTSQGLGQSHLITKLAGYLRAELGHSDLISPFAFQPPPSRSQPALNQGDPMSSISSVASDMELLAVHPFDIYPGAGDNLVQAGQNMDNVPRSYANGATGHYYPMDTYEPVDGGGEVMTNETWTQGSKWPSNGSFGEVHQPEQPPSIHNTAQAFVQPYTTYPSHLAPPSSSPPSSTPDDSPNMHLHPQGPPTRSDTRSRRSSDASSMHRALFREQARPYSRSGLPSAVSSSGQSIRSVKSDKGQSSREDSSESLEPRRLQPLNGRTELYVFDEMTQTVARVSPGMEGLTGDAPVVEFPPGSYYRVFHEDLEVLPSDIGHGRAVLWLRGQRCVAKCRFRLEGKRPAVIRAHFATCKLRENLSVDPLGRLCRLQVEARRWMTERDRERLASGASSLRSLTPSNGDSDDSRSIRSEYSIHSTGSSSHTYASMPHQQVGPIRPIRSRQFPDGRPLSLAHVASNDVPFGAGDPQMSTGMVESTIGPEEGAYALLGAPASAVGPPSSGVTAQGAMMGHWSDQWLSKVGSTDTLHGDVSRTTILRRAGSQRSTRSTVAAAGGGAGASFLSIE